MVAAILIEKGSDVNAANDVGGTALIWAAVAGSEKTTSLLLKNGVDVQHATERGSNALHNAVEANNEVVVRLLIQRGADVNALQDSRWQSPSHIAVTRSNESIMRILLEARAVPDVQTPRPLHLLLQRGADPDRKYDNGQTPMHYAARHGSLEAVSLLLPLASSLAAVDDQHRTVLAHAVNVKNEKDGGDVVRLLLSTQRVDIDACDVDGCTALAQARALGLKNIEHILLEHGEREP